MSDLGNRTVFATNLQRLLTDNGMTRADLAARLGIAYSTVSDWYNAISYPRIDMIERMTRIFGVSKSEMIEEQTSSVTDANAKWLMDKIAKAGPEEAAMMRRLYEAVDKERFND